MTNMLLLRLCSVVAASLSPPPRQRYCDLSSLFVGHARCHVSKITSLIFTKFVTDVQRL